MGLWQPGTHTGFVISGNPGTPVRFELNSHMGTAVRDFLAQSMALEAQPTLGPMTYFTLHADGKPRYSVMQMQEARVAEQNAWIVYLQCPEVDAMAEQVKELGGQVLAGPIDSPFGRIAVCTDPMGSRFMLIRSAGG